MRFLLIITIALVVGCLGTETGNPPAAPTPEVDVSRIELADDLTGIRITGLPDAIRPGGGTARLLNIDGVAGLVVTGVAADGSFDVTVEGDTSNRIRLQAELDGIRARPIDFLESLPASIPCVSSDPEIEVDFATVAVGSPEPVIISFTNGCGGDVMVVDQRLRLGDPAFVITTPAPLVTPNGATGTVELDFTPAGPGEAEDVLILDFDVGDRVAITLYGRGA